MRKRPTDLLFAVITAATVLVVLSSLAALFSSWHIAGLFRAAINENFPALLAAEELEIALLEQRGFVSSYMIEGGNREWLEELQRRKDAFSDWMIEARDTARTSEQMETLDQLERVYRTYDETRDEVVALYDRGDTDQAYVMFLYELNTIYHEAFLLCEDFVAANQRYVDSATARARSRIRQVTWMVLVCVGLTIGLGGVSLWVLARGLRAEQARRGHEAHLLAARRIQEHLLPDTVPDLPELDIHSVWYPAEFAAGDYYDYLRFSDGSLGVVVGDVTGHGIGPALLTTSTRAYLRSLVQTRMDLGDILSLANSILVGDIDEGRFITLVLVRLDLQSKSLTYISAGHPPGYVFDVSGNIKARLESTTLPLGISTDACFATSDPIPLTPGDIIVLLTDGIPEAMCAKGGFFGMERTLEFVRANRTRPAREIAEGLYQAVCRYAGRGRLTDDVTATVIKVESDQDDSLGFETVSKS